MADNYLEKKMEEHRLASSAKSYSRRMSPGGNKPGTLAVRFDPLRVIVTDGSTAVGEATVRRFMNAGCRVAFLSADMSQGRRLSQSTGSRFYQSTVFDLCSAVKDIERKWGGVDAFILTDNRPTVPAGKSCKRVIAIGTDGLLPEVDERDGLTVNAVNPEGITADDVSQLCLYLCLPSSGFISRQRFFYNI